MAGGKVKKGFFYYLSVFVFILLGIFCVFAAILIFNPGKDVFGIGLRYVSIKKNIDYYKTTDEANEQISDKYFSAIEFNSGFTSFNIDYSKDETFVKVSFKPSVVGLSKSEYCKFNVSVEVIDGRLCINVSEPDVWIGFAKKASVSVVCPKNSNFALLSLNVTTESGSVSIGDSKDVTHYIHDLKISTKTGDVAIYNNVNIASGNISIEAEKSNININSDITGTCSIENGKGKLNIGTLAGNLKLISTDRIEAVCNNIGGDVFAQTNNGYIKIKNLGYTNVYKNGKTEKTYGYVENVTGGSVSGYYNGNFTTLDTLTNTNVIVENMCGNASITGETGYVQIDNLRNQALIETTSGNVEIGMAKNKLDIKTVNGAITFTQAGSSAVTTINSEKGRITGNFTKMYTAYLTTDSNIVLNVATGEPFMLEYETKNGIKASWITSELEKSGTLAVSCETSSNLIKAVATNGNITVNEKSATEILTKEK